MSYQGRWSRPTAWWCVIVPPAATTTSVAALLTSGHISISAPWRPTPEGVVRRGTVRVDVGEAAAQRPCAAHRPAPWSHGAARGVELGPAVPGDRGLEGVADAAQAGGGAGAAPMKLRPLPHGALAARGAAGAVGDDDVVVVDFAAAVAGDPDSRPDVGVLGQLSRFEGEDQQRLLAVEPGRRRASAGSRRRQFAGQSLAWATWRAASEPASHDRKSPRRRRGTWGGPGCASTPR